MHSTNLYEHLLLAKHCAKNQGIQYINKTISSWKVYGLILGKQACQTRGQRATSLLYLACGPPQQVWHTWARMLHNLWVTNEGEDRWENQTIEEHFPSSALGPSLPLPVEHWRIPFSFLLSAHSVELSAKATQATSLAGPCVQQTEEKRPVLERQVAALAGSRSAQEGFPLIQAKPSR